MNRIGYGVHREGDIDVDKINNLPYNVFRFNRFHIAVSDFWRKNIRERRICQG